MAVIKTEYQGLNTVKDKKDRALLLPDNLLICCIARLKV